MAKKRNRRASKTASAKKRSKPASNSSSSKSTVEKPSKTESKISPDQVAKNRVAPTPVKRLDIGFFSVGQIVLALVVTILAFYLGLTQYGRKDLTVGTEFTLSETTTKLLESPLLQERKKPALIIAALRQSSPHYSRVRTLLTEYERLAPEKIEIDFLDPVRNQDRALEVSNNYGTLLKDQLFAQDMLIVDARQEAAEGPARIRFLPLEQLLVKRTDDKKQRRVVGYRDEAFVTSALLSALEGTPRRMYLIADKTDLDIGDLESPWQVLTETLLRQNILLVPLRISETSEIPADAEGVVIVSPKYDFEEAEMKVLQTYWARPNSSLLCLFDPSGRPLELLAFLRKHGINLRNDRVLSVKNGRTEAQVRATFIGGAAVNESLADKATTFEGKVSSLEVREGASDLTTNGIQVFPLVIAADGYWGETSYTEPNPAFDDATDLGAPLYLAASVIKGNANSDNTADNVSKMVVTSTSGFLHPDRLREEQLDFVKNSTNWLLGREDLLGIGPRALERRKLNLLPAEVSQIDRLVIFLIPTTLLLLSLLVWQTRRQ